VAAEAVERARVQDYHLALADALRVQAVAQARGGRRQEAQQVFEEVVRLCREMPYPYAEARALYEWGRAYLEQHEPDQARKPLTEALAIFRQLGARPYIEWTQRDLAVLVP
jgi:tetratricopeptide (TPR) repeat protein